MVRLVSSPVNIVTDGFDPFVLYKNKFIVFTDCFGSISAGSLIGDSFFWIDVGSGSITQGDTDGGVWVMNTNASATNTIAVGTDSDIIRLGQGEAIFEARVNIPTLSSASEEFDVRIGFLDNTDASDGLLSDAIDGVYFEYDRNSSVNWRICASNNSVRTKTNSSVAVATGFLKFRIVVNAAGTSAEFFVDGTSLGTVTTNIPTNSARLTGVSAGIFKSVGTTNRTLQLDYIGAMVDQTTPRS